MLTNIKACFDERDSFIFEYGGGRDFSFKDRVQLIASLIKPIVNYYVRSKIDIDLKISAFFDTSLTFKIEDLLMHRSGVWDYLQHLNEEEINKISLEDISKEILDNTDEKELEIGNYSNSGFEKGMGTMKGSLGKVWAHGGFVPRFETLVAYNEKFKLVYFKQNTPELSGITDKIFDLLSK